MEYQTSSEVSSQIQSSKYKEYYQLMIVKPFRDMYFVKIDIIPDLFEKEENIAPVIYDYLLNFVNEETDWECRNCPLLEFYNLHKNFFIIDYNKKEIFINKDFENDLNIIRYIFDLVMFKIWEIGGESDTLKINKIRISI